MMGGMMMSGGLLTPADIPAVTHWYDPTHTPSVQIVTGTSVAALYNRIAGVGHPITNSSGGGGAGWPTREGNRWIKNDGGQWLNGVTGFPSAPIGPAPVGTAEGWVFTFANASYDPVNGNKFMFGYGNPSSTTSARVVGLSLTNDDFYYPMVSISGSGGGYLVRKTTNHWQTDVLIAGRFLNGAIELWVDGVLITTSSATLNTPALSNVAMFKNPDYTQTDGGVPPIQGNFDFKGRVGNSIISGALTTVERQAIEGFIVWAHNKPERLPSNHPHRYSPPTT